METKEELSEKINELLETEIDFTKLTKEDLSTLLETVRNIKEATEFPLPIFKKPLREVLENKELLSRPLGDMTLGDILGNLVKGRGERQSLFGFGIIPIPGTILKRREKSETPT